MRSSTLGVRELGFVTLESTQTLEVKHLLHLEVKHPRQLGMVLGYQVCGEPWDICEGFSSPSQWKKLTSDQGKWLKPSSKEVFERHLYIS